MGEFVNRVGRERESVSLVSTHDQDYRKISLV